MPRFPFPTLAFALILAGCTATANPALPPSDPPAPGPTAPGPGPDLADLIDLHRQHGGYAPDPEAPGPSGFAGYSITPVSIAPAERPPFAVVGPATVQAGEWCHYEVVASLSGNWAYFWTAEGGAYPATDTGREFTVRWAVPGRHRVALLPTGADGPEEPVVRWIVVTGPAE